MEKERPSQEECRHNILRYTHKLPSDGTTDVFYCADCHAYVMKADVFGGIWIRTYEELKSG